ncbi:SnoaL-like domain protein [Pseudovibrio axinellae]|uniref:SnoaL-like domain protein n=1 Tax=Pseudovibrio axinellae TaxID=989403 RepID=A0A165XSL5_9HYPH|nr:nuclear transport factor 2 family protein [Pseudovibrio axinellae]KZL17997.1 SnoaL-like domain protein [Pseudovibrio axinellae]SER14058.1 SnoaL-like domain-containing protein [Pseudovibrio axinellae]
MTDRDTTARRYACFFEKVTPERINEVHALISDDVHFIDPFNDVVGRDSFEKVFHKMYEDVQQPTFKILDLAWSRDLCFMRWDFTCTQKLLGEWGVRGLTELHFDKDAKVCAHYDYWDASRHFYRKLPIVGLMIKWIASRASI